jgi:hypothetical protein
MICLHLTELTYLQDEQSMIEFFCSSTFRRVLQRTAHLQSLTEHKHSMCGSIFLPILLHQSRSMGVFFNFDIPESSNPHTSHRRVRNLCW